MSMRVSFQFISKSANNILAGFVCVFRHVLEFRIAMTSKPYTQSLFVKQMCQLLLDSLTHLVCKVHTGKLEYGP